LPGGFGFADHNCIRMLQGFVRQYRRVNSLRHHLHTVFAIAVRDFIRPQHQVGHDGNADQINILPRIISVKCFVCNRYRMLYRRERRKQGRIVFWRAKV
jgi:hypothetical protein